MKKNLLNFLWVLLLIGTQSYAQNRTITGKVTGKDDGLPLPGVSVVVKGTKLGTQTTSDGSFSIIVPSGNQSLVFSFVGYTTATFPVSGARLNVTLATSASALNEVVVVGYGVQEKREVTGSVGKVNGSDISNLAAPSFDKQLQGRVTGVQVSTNNGILGSAPTIRIRGNNSITQGNGPLYVVDGVPIVTGNQSGVTPTNPLGDINPNDIESFEVLKDGSATAIYGSRAANGVVLITTKKGKAGRQTINYDNWFSWASTAKRFKLLNADQFIQISNEKFANAGITAPQAFPTLDPSGKPYDTDWQDVIFRTGFQQNHYLSVSGGSENGNYYFSGGFTDLKGNIVANSQRKYSIKSRVEQKALNFLTLGFNSGVTYTQNNGLNTGTNSLSGNVTNALLVFPNVPVFNADGSYNLSPDGTKLGQGANLRQIDNNYTNIQYVLDHNINRNQNLTLNGTAFIDAKIINGLNVRSQIGVNSLYGEDYQYYDPFHGDGRGSNGVIFQQYIPTFNYDWQNTLSYNKVFGSHKINFVAGAEFQKERDRNFAAQGTGLSNTYFSSNNIISSTLATPSIYGDFYESSIKSYFARFNYAYKEKYLLTLTDRIDYLSKLAPGHQKANLPGGSLGWRISKEDFFAESSALSFVNDFKLRGGYAKTGNTNLTSYYPFASSYAPAQYGAQSGLSFSRLGNSALSFETSKKLDIGFDLAMFNNRLTITADYYKNTNDGLIQNVQTPLSLGVPGNVIAENVGKLYNKGFELAVSSINIKSKDFTWSTDFNITFNKNRVTELYGGLDLVNTYNITRVGVSANSFYGYQYAGVNAANGNPLYIKGNGQMIQGNIATTTYYNYDPSNPTALTTQSSLGTADKKVLGNSAPTYFGGFNNTFRYKQFDLGVFFTFAGGNKVMNATRQEDLLNQAFNNNGVEILNRWTTPGQITNTPRLYYGSGYTTFINTTGSTNSRFLEDGKFIRAQNMTLGYTLPSTWASKAKLSKVHVYAGVQNAFIITHYKGADPELSNTGTGVDFNANPTPRNIIVGLNVGF